MRHCQRKVATDMCAWAWHWYLQKAMFIYSWQQLLLHFAGCHSKLPQVAPLVRQAKERTHFTCGSVAFVV